MTNALLAVSVLLVCVLALLLRWFFAGSPAESALEANPANVASGFPEAKYKAIARLLDEAELHALASNKRLNMAPELASRLIAGRRQILSAYIDELSQDFFRVHRLYWQTEALHAAPRPGAAGVLAMSWFRFEWMLAKAAWNLNRDRGLPTMEIAGLVDETRAMYGRFPKRPVSDAAGWGSSES